MTGRLRVTKMHATLKEMRMPARIAHQKRRIVKKRVARFAVEETQ